MSSKQKNNRVFLWCTGIDDFINNKGFVGGILVQMSFWAKTFVSNGWDVFSFSANGIKDTMQGVTFISKKTPPLIQKLHVTFFENLLSALKVVYKLRPQIIIVRGACRELYFLSLICKFKKIKLVLMGASDVNFCIGQDWLSGSKIITKLYRRSVKKIDYIVAQNEFQSDSLISNYNKSSLIIPNIWVPIDCEQSCDKQFDAIWVANISPLKQVEWFMRLADSLPMFKFAIVGGVGGNSNLSYYNKISQDASNIGNLFFLGAKSFNDTTSLIFQSKLLVCTSKFEGFPNTFLQAWAMSVPVVSTVDPNGVIEKNKIGKLVLNEDDLLKGVKTLLDNGMEYNQCLANIQSYFEKNHESKHAFEKLIAFVNCKVV